MPSIGHWLCDLLWDVQASYLALKTTNQRVLLVKTWSVLVADEFLVPDRTCHWTFLRRGAVGCGSQRNEIAVCDMHHISDASNCLVSELINESWEALAWMPRKHWGACGATRAVMVQWNPQLLVTPALHVVILWDNLSCMTQAMQLKAQSHK